MSSWIDLLYKPDGIRAIYGADLPTLRSVDLHEFSLHRDGPVATLRFDLAEFPRMPPKKWADQGFNVVQVQLSLGGVQRLTVVGWETNVTIDIDVERRGDVISLGTMNGPVGMKIEARSLILSRLSAHCDAFKEVVTDITVHRIEVFGAVCDELIREICEAGGRAVLERLQLPMLDPRFGGCPDLSALEAGLREIRDQFPAA